MKFIILFLVLQLYIPCLLIAHCRIIEEHRFPSGVCNGTYVIDYIEGGPIEHVFLCVETDTITGNCKKLEYVGCFQVVIYH
jgi:hypothetical protein